MRAHLRALWADPDTRFALGAFVVGRVLVSGFAALGWQLPHWPADRTTGWNAEPPAHAWHAMFTGLERFDAQWYLQLARDGYSPGDPSSAYFPGYPLLVGAVGRLLGGHWLLAATLVSNAALLTALVLLLRLTRREIGPGAARWAVLLLLFSPVGFFLYAPYSESLFLLLSVACLTWVREGRWWPAAGAAALASATRSTGLVLAAAMAAEALHRAHWWPTGRVARRELLRALPACAAAGGGLVAYLAYWQLRSSWREPTTSLQDDFKHQPSAPWTALWHGITQTADTFTDSQYFAYTSEAVLALLAFALAVVAVRRYAPAYGALVVGSLIMPLTMVIPYRALNSVARYDLVVFPLFWALAELVRRPWLRAATLAASVLLLGGLTMQFASWHRVL